MPDQPAAPEAAPPRAPGAVRTSPAALAHAMRLAEELVLRHLDDIAASGDADPRWLQLGRTQIEQGFMAVDRALRRPGRIALPADLDA